MSRAALFWFVWSLVLMALTVVELAAVRSAVRQAQEYRESGAATIILVAEGRIDGAACDALGSVPGVHAAGATRRASSDRRTAVMPSSTVPSYEVTDGLAALLSGQRVDSTGVLLSDDVAEALGVDTGARLRFQDGAESLIAERYSYPDDGRRVGYGYALLMPTSPASGTFDECWVDAWPVSSELDQLLRGTLRPGSEVSGSSNPTVTQLNSTLGTAFTGAQDYADRLTRFAGPAAACFGLALGWIAVRVRRVQLAGALHDGVTRWALSLITAIEVAAWSLAGLLACTALLTSLICTGTPEASSSSWVCAGRIGTTATVGLVLGVAAGLLSIRERRLVTYVRDR